MLQDAGLIRRIKLRQRILNANKDCPRSNPKFGFRALHAATTCGSSGGKGLVACSRCGVPTIIGWTQSTAIPMPDLAPFGTNPAPRHAALISAHGPPIGPGSARNGTDEPDTNKPTTVTRIAIARIMSLVAC